MTSTFDPGGPDRWTRPVALVTVVSAALMTTAAAGVGLLREPDPVRVVTGTVTLLVLLVALGVGLCRSEPGSGARPGAPVAVGVLAVAAVASVPLLAPAGAAQGWMTWAWVAAGLAGSAPLLLGWRAGLTAAAVVTGVSVAVGQWVAAAAVPYAVLTVLAAAVLLLVHLLPLRLWQLVVAAQTGRDAAVRLAAAEERLRLAADVHDVLGHHLTVIGLQAELAARTAHTDPGAAAEHAEQARGLAAHALGEMRRVVHGRRTADLAAELTAVAGVLRASGVRTTLSGEPATGLPAETGTALAATLREAATNVLRHSRARWCTISVVDGDDGTELRISNDGAAAPLGTSPGPDRYSSGLHGLAARLGALGGRLDTGLDGDVFVLRASVPAP
ncbi:sensor histidine kinase [Pseudonocardia sp. HH130630-07]|uniref:sensor histidine kinase n=1 Tax=Pseudonocardia sp. HH130630-07 TaxID=1690815 RepID=UPI000815051F|nr:histidine kinase [Pseudonocardia sp. HH130630-07]ANY07830.1 hypothetical protein AFB00_17720 [Pseudonocardia sp. HH130630-07]